MWRILNLSSSSPRRWEVSARTVSRVRSGAKTALDRCCSTSSADPPEQRSRLSSLSFRRPMGGFFLFDRQILLDVEFLHPLAQRGAGDPEKTGRLHLVPASLPQRLDDQFTLDCRDDLQPA